MRLCVAFLSLVFVAGLAVAQDEDKPAVKKAAPKAKPKADSDTLDLPVEENPLGKKAGDTKEIVSRASYAMGMLIGRQLKQGGLEPDMKRLIKGLQDSLSDSESELTDEELQAALQAFDPIARKNVAERSKAAANKNLKAGQDFLDANKDKDGVKSTKSGLQYKVLVSGKGASPKATDTVRVHYRGKLIDGKVFDQSYEGETPTKKEQPAEFTVNQVIPGWTEALQKMKAGDKWQLYIPAELAYGPNQRGPVIGPNSVLVFDVELLEIVE